MTKSELRKEIRSILKNISSEERAVRSEQICRNFEQAELAPLLSRATNILFYMPLANEVDITPLILTAMKQNKNCFLPRVCHAEPTFCHAEFSSASPENPSNMTFYKLDNSIPLEEQLENGSYGIREPKTTLEKFDITQHASDTAKNSDILVIVPGLAFGKDGSRLGKGKGYYDRFFAKYDTADSRTNALPDENMTKTMTKIAVCFDCQLLDTVPHENYDKKVDIIVSETMTCFVQ